MPLPSSGDISLNQVNTELGLSATAPISLEDTAVRALFQKVGSGVQISFSDGWGKSATFVATISSNLKEMNLRNWAFAAGWNGNSYAEITVSPGVYIWSDNTSVAAMTVNGSWPSGIKLINNGYIIGRGGNGGGQPSPAYARSGWNGNPGGPALSLGTNITIENLGYIAGGGGGSAGVSTAGFDDMTFTQGGAGGAGGGEGAPNMRWLGSFQSGGNEISIIGTGGAPGQEGGDGGIQNPNVNLQVSNTIGYSSGGGGRILPGVGGTAAATGVVPAQGGGAGGGGGYNFLWAPGQFNPNVPIVRGILRSGGGGGWGAAGGNAQVQGPGGGGAGGSANNPGQTVSGGNSAFGAVGGSGGAAVLLNGYTVTWTAFGNRWGSIS